jgi:hypothetical protein
MGIFHYYELYKIHNKEETMRQVARTAAPSRAQPSWVTVLLPIKKWKAARQEAQFQAGVNYWNNADPTERAFIESEQQTSSAFDRGILAARSAGAQ